MRASSDLPAAPAQAYLAAMAADTKLNIPGATAAGVGGATSAATAADRAV